MKKLLALVLALMMVIAMAACGGTTPSSEATSSSEAAPESSTPAESSSAAATEVDFPKKEITIIVPWAAGGAADITCRKLQSIIKETQGLDIVVSVVEGGSGAIGLTQVMNSPADGYTLGYASSTWLSQLALQTVDFKYEDCAVASTVYDEAFCIVVPKNSPYQTAQQLMDAVKANPGTITIGGSGSGNVNNTLPLLLAKTVDSTFNYTSFSGGSRVLTEVLGGHSDAAILKPVEVMEQVKSGDLIVLGVFGHNRLDALGADIPTFEELGYDLYADGDVAMASYLMVPAGIDPAVMDKLGQIFNDAMATKEFQDYCAEYAFTCNPIHGEEATTYITTIYDAIASLFPQLYS